MYPVMLDLRGRSVLVVGAGPVATRKVEGLIAEGALVTVVAPDVCSEMEELVTQGLISVLRRGYETSDLDDRWLVVTATANKPVQQQVFDEGEARGIWVNAADDPDRCAFILPAVLREGPVTISVSTGGASPALAGWLRTRMRSALPANLTAIAEELAGRRRAIKERGESTEALSWLPIIDEVVAKYSTGSTPPVDESGVIG